MQFGKSVLTDVSTEHPASIFKLIEAGEENVSLPVSLPCITQLSLQLLIYRNFAFTCVCFAILQTLKPAGKITLHVFSLLNNHILEPQFLSPQFTYRHAVLMCSREARQLIASFCKLSTNLAKAVLCLQNAIVHKLSALNKERKVAASGCSVWCSLVTKARRWSTQVLTALLAMNFVRQPSCNLFCASFLPDFITGLQSN